MGVVALVSMGAFAQSDPYDPSSPNYVGNKAKVKLPKWNANIEASLLRGFDKLSEEAAYYQALVGYSFSKSLKGNVMLGYSHPLDGDAENPDRWQLEDVRLQLTNPSIWKSESKAQNLSLVGSLSLPTSTTSQNAGQIFSSSIGARFSHRWSKFTFLASPRLVASWHQYETRDQDGYVKNSPLGLSFGLTLRYAVSRKAALLTGASLYSAFDYDFGNKNVQTVFGAVQYTLTKKSYLVLSARWRDRILSNNSLFDDDASMASLSFGYSI